jgi:hypothetical protein
MVPEQEIVYGGVATDVRVFQAVTRETTGQEACDGALYAVVFVPVNELVADPEQGAVAWTSYVAGAVEEHDIVFPARLSPATLCQITLSGLDPCATLRRTSESSRPVFNLTVNPPTR